MISTTDLQYLVSVANGEWSEVVCTGTTAAPTTTTTTAVPTTTTTTTAIPTTTTTTTPATDCNPQQNDNTGQDFNVWANVWDVAVRNTVGSFTLFGSMSSCMNACYSDDYVDECVACSTDRTGTYSTSYFMISTTDPQYLVSVADGEWSEIVCTDTTAGPTTTTTTTPATDCNPQQNDYTGEDFNVWANVWDVAVRNTVGSFTLFGSMSSCMNACYSD